MSEEGPTLTHAIPLTDVPGLYDGTIDHALLVSPGQYLVVFPDEERFAVYDGGGKLMDSAQALPSCVIGESHAGARPSPGEHQERALARGLPAPVAGERADPNALDAALTYMYAWE